MGHYGLQGAGTVLGFLFHNLSLPSAAAGGFESRKSSMRLLGKYDFESLRNAFQGVFSFSQVGPAYIIELWQIRFSMIPNNKLDIDVRRSDNSFIRIGTISLSETNK